MSFFNLSMFHFLYVDKKDAQLIIKRKPAPYGAGFYEILVLNKFLTCRRFTARRN